MRLVLHTAAYWLITLREAVPKTNHLSNAEFATLRLKLLKLGARVIENVSRIRLAFAPPVPRPACSDKSLSRCSPEHHKRRGIKAPPKPKP